MDGKFDAIVLGLGAMGSAAIYQLAKRGVSVLGIDRFSPPHTLGSTHGDTRITRQSIGEGEQYMPLALRSYDLWQEVEEATGEDLLTVTGGLIISSSRASAMHGGAFFSNTLSAATTYNIRHEMLDAAQMRAKFPQFNVRDDELGYYEYNAGFLRPEACVAAQLRLAKQHGAAIHVNEKAVGFAESNGVVRVKTDHGEYGAEQVVVSVGPWLPGLIEPEYGTLFRIYRQVLYWFDIGSHRERFRPENCPVFIWSLGQNARGMYGFPAVDGADGGVKVATAQYEASTTPDAVQRNVSAEEARVMYESFVAPYLPDLTSKCLKAVSCLYTVTPDGGFVIDRHPQYSSVILASPCSGHGFKHSAAIGEVLAELVTDGRSTIDISSFSLGRFGDTAK